jgi:acetyltransferase-like isoleucine patch superfamily enzyme
MAILDRIEKSITWRLSRGMFGRICRASVAHQPFIFGDETRVSIAASSAINDALLNCSSGTITIGEHVMIAHGVQLLTGTHDSTKTGAARMSAVPQYGRDIVVEDGAWVASGAIVLGPCVIGKNAVVAAGSVVHGDVPDGATVGGIPARPLSKDSELGFGPRALRQRP